MCLKFSCVCELDNLGGKKNNIYIAIELDFVESLCVKFFQFVSKNRMNYFEKKKGFL